VAVVVPPNVGAGLLAPNVLGVEDEKEKPLLVGAAPNAGVVVAVPPKLNPDVEVAGAPKVAAGAGAVPPKLKLGAAAGTGAAPNDGVGVEPNDGAGVEPKAGVVVAPKEGVVPNVPPVDPPKLDMVEVAGCAPNEKAGVVEAAAGNEKPPVSDAPKCLGLRDEASIPSTSALLSAWAGVPPKLKAGVEVPPNVLVAGVEAAPNVSPVLAGLLTPPKLKPPAAGSVFAAPPNEKPTLADSAGLAVPPKLNAGGVASEGFGAPPKLNETGLDSSAFGAPPKLNAGVAAGLDSVPPKLKLAAGLASVVEPPKLNAGTAGGSSAFVLKLNAGLLSSFLSPKLNAGAGSSVFLDAAPNVNPPGGLSSVLAAPNVNPVLALVVVVLPKSKLVLVPKPVDAVEVAGAAPNLKLPVLGVLLVVLETGFSGSLAPGLSVSQALHFTTSSGLLNKHVPQFHPEGFTAPAANNGPGAITAGLAGAAGTAGLDDVLAVPHALHTSTPTSLLNMHAEQLQPLGANFAMRFIAPGTVAGGAVATGALVTEAEGLGPGLAVLQAIHASTVLALFNIQPSHDHPLGANFAMEPAAKRPPRGLTSAASTCSVLTIGFTSTGLALFLGFGD